MKRLYFVSVVILGVTSEELEYFRIAVIHRRLVGTQRPVTQFSS